MDQRSSQNSKGHVAEASSQENKNSASTPSISLPKGGGAIHDMGEKFAANPVTGTGSMSVPIATSAGRSGFGPQLSVSYDSGAGNGPFGFGWSLSIPSITRKTDKGLPQYKDANESDVFILSGAEDLVPILKKDVKGNWIRDSKGNLTYDQIERDKYTIRFYRPRIEGLFARIERWTNQQTGEIHWRSISKDNITTLYGKREDARIADPTDSTHIFSWSICESYDDKGNAIFYHYKFEDDKNVSRVSPCENNRLKTNQYAQHYLKSIKYGNRTPREQDEDLTKRTDWLFEVIFDYGEHDATAPTTKETQAWPVRTDPFSAYRSTFEVRTYRLCRRVLMLHHFPDELAGVADYLVRSTDFEYTEDAIASFITSATQSGYVRKPDGTYLRKSLPKLTFKYTEARVNESVHTIDQDSIQNLPYGLDGSHYQWIDLDSEGLSGVLTEQADTWFYKRNLGNGAFDSVERIVHRPSISALGGGQQQLLDLAGDGSLDLVQFDAPMAGFYERTAKGDWDAFTPFKSRPNISSKDPNLRFVDLTGDGHADILISEHTVFTWYPSNAEEGFGPAERTSQSWDEEKGPKLVFSDPTQSIFLADMSGDGLTDIVRIRNGEVCYWANLGYGRFGQKVTMGGSPWFDRLEQFDQKRIRLADIDGSGVTDIIYLGTEEIHLYFNQSGNAWSPPQRLTHFPRVDNLKTVTVVDLLGNGTACLVWSSPLSSDLRKPMRYIDLMGGQKPHLLVYSTNNMGAETEVQYTASTQFYLQDRKEGRPWVTKLPFPVHVVERVESRDLVSNTKLVSTYTYRHGYFDGVEREFRGFAYVEQRDAETLVGQFDLPPIVTKTWFHNGAFLEGTKLEAYFKNPKNKEFFNGDNEAIFLPDTELPPDLTAAEMREACRALNGSILRQEVYTDDKSAKSELPYSVSERSYQLTPLQPRGPNPHAVFFSHPSETIDYHYERNLVDPRISHALTLEVDSYGNVLKSLAIGYQRRTPAFDEQKQTLATLTENFYTNPLLEADAYHTPLPAEAKTYELTAPELKGTKPLDFETALKLATTATELTYEVTPTTGQTQKRLIEHVRSLYRKNDLSGLLPTGKLESMALPGESYKLAFTPGVLDTFQLKATRAQLSSLLKGAEGAYRDLDGNGSLWIPSGLIFFSANPGDNPQQESDFAKTHFFLPHRFQDPFGNESLVTYDGNYNLLMITTRDAVGNEVKAEHDYRVLQPRLVTDPNDNRTEVRFDALGMVVGTAVMGKTAGPVEGDNFTKFAPDLTLTDIKTFFDSADPRPLAIDHLGTATTRIIYDLERVPVCATAIARETHVGDLKQGEQTKVQLHFVYSDGFGREAQTKAQAEPGPLDPNIAGSPILNPRWVGTGAKIYNNKGKPVRQFEPFFSSTPQFGIEKVGVSSTLFYDPMERVVAILHPNHTFEKVVFDPWQQTAYDVNDTVTFDPETDEDVKGFFTHLSDSEYLPTWYQERINGSKGAEEKAAAEKTEKHADTPTVAHFDTLGRTFLTLADNGKDANGNPQKFRTRTVLDIEGNQREVIDAKDRIVMRYDYDMLGTHIHQASMEAGERWMLNDATGKPIRVWNSRQYVMRTEYDALHRPLRSFVQGGDPSDPSGQLFPQDLLYEKTIYGDSPDTGLSDPQQRQNNLRGKVFRHYDSAGLVNMESYDFKGNLLRSSRQFATDYKNTPDWSQSPALETETFSSSTAFDALNRAATVTAPDHSIYHPTFNEANLLDKVEVSLQGKQQNGQPVWTAFVNNIDYNAKGQRTQIDYVNGAKTTYEYDDKTFRLTHLNTTRPPSAGGFLGGLFGNPNALASQIFKNVTTVQNLYYTYDPAGNITRIQDGALQTVIHKGETVEPVCQYNYDALYRLIEATGREHIGQSAFAFTPPDDNYRDFPFVGAGQLNDLQAVRNYTEQYVYDPVGNFEKMIHQAASGNWTRAYSYNENSLIETPKKSNRLSSTTLQPNSTALVESYSYDAHGNMTKMPHLPQMRWDFRNQLSASSRQVVNSSKKETTYYIYGAGGQRVRKITETQTSALKNQRFYLGGFEIYREYRNGSVDLVRETLQLMDDKQRIALVETKLVENGKAINTPAPLQRYQLGNHLGSASLELDGTGGLVSYEEYSPYGSTAYQAGRSAAEVSLKRFRYTGKERDDETGFTYHGARYYMPWLGKWVSCDPLEIVDGPNLYRYGRSNPIIFRDPSGMLSWGQIIGIGAAIVVGTAVTVLTGGLAAPLVGTAAAAIIGGAVGGAIGGAVGAAIETKIDKGKVDWGIVGRSALIGGLVGGALAGVGVLASAGLRTAAGQALAQRITTSSAGQLLTGLARRAANSAVGRGYSTAIRNLGEPAERVGQAASERLGVGPGARAATSAGERAVETQANIRGVQGAQREVSQAGSREFVHSTESSAIPAVSGASIEAQGALRLSPKGASGQWGEGAYAFEGSLQEVPSSTGFQFRVPPQTAVETVQLPGSARPIIRLVPPPGVSQVPIRITGSGFSPQALDTGRQILQGSGLQLQGFGYPGVSADVTGGTGFLGGSLGVGAIPPQVDPPPQPAVSVGVTF
jgi:RHS repeat-associated protein